MPKGLAPARRFKGIMVSGSRQSHGHARVLFYEPYDDDASSVSNGREQGATLERRCGVGVGVDLLVVLANGLYP